jgi:hypothetical protein
MPPFIVGAHIGSRATSDGGLILARELDERLGFGELIDQSPQRLVLDMDSTEIPVHGQQEQWIREGKQAVKMTRLSCHRFRSNEVRLWLAVIAYNPGNRQRGVPFGPGATGEDQPLVTNEPTATVGANRRPAGEARPPLLTAAGREPSDQAAVQRDGTKDCRPAGTNRIGC